MGCLECRRRRWRFGVGGENGPALLDLDRAECYCQSLVFWCCSGVAPGLPKERLSDGKGAMNSYEQRTKRTLPVTEIAAATIKWGGLVARRCHRARSCARVAHSVKTSGRSKCLRCRAREGPKFIIISGELRTFIFGAGGRVAGVTCGDLPISGPHGP
jgi:hypothetical protein